MPDLQEIQKKYNSERKFERNQNFQRNNKSNFNKTLLIQKNNNNELEVLKKSPKNYIISFNN